MYNVMCALREVNFNGVIIPDHVPYMMRGSRAADGYTIACMEACQRGADEKVGG
jgi:mannonate dehydratase